MTSKLIFTFSIFFFCIRVYKGKSILQQTWLFSGGRWSFFSTRSGNSVGVVSKIQCPITAGVPTSDVFHWWTRDSETSRIGLKKKKICWKERQSVTVTPLQFVSHMLPEKLHTDADLSFSSSVSQVPSCSKKCYFTVATFYFIFFLTFFCPCGGHWEGITVPQ